MGEVPLEVRKKLWLYLYSDRAFHVAIEAAQHIVDEKLAWGMPLYSPLYSSAIINYTKPFGRNRKIGCLDKTFVPSEYIEAHETFIDLRNQMFAHFDGETFEAEWGGLNQLRLEIEDGKVSPLIFEILGGGMDVLINMSETLRSSVSKLFWTELKPYFGELPRKNGHYLISLSEEDEFLIPVDQVDR